MILGDGADHHRLGFPAIDIMVHIMLGGLLSKLVDKLLHTSGMISLNNFRQCRVVDELVSQAGRS